MAAGQAQRQRGPERATRPLNPHGSGQGNGKEQTTMGQPAFGWGWPQQRIRRLHTKARGSWLSAAAGDEGRTPGSNHFVLQCSCPEHKGHATLVPDEPGQKPTGKTHTRQHHSQKGLGSNTRTRYPSPAGRTSSAPRGYGRE